MSFPSSSARQLADHHFPALFPGSFVSKLIWSFHPQVSFGPHAAVLFTWAFDLIGCDFAQLSGCTLWTAMLTFQQLDCAKVLGVCGEMLQQKHFQIHTF